jgi:hypothetical protein
MIATGRPPGYSHPDRNARASILNARVRTDVGRGNRLPTMCDAGRRVKAVTRRTDHREVQV